MTFERKGRLHFNSTHLKTYTQMTRLAECGADVYVETDPSTMLFIEQTPGSLWGAASHTRK